MSKQRENAGYDLLLGEDTTPTVGEVPESDASPTNRRQGRRGDPSYTQLAGYVPKELHRRVRIALFEDGREFGELLEELFIEWLKRRDDQSTQR